MKGEFERIAALRSRLERSRADIAIGMGDDAAVLSPSDASQVLTVDVAVEDVHFRRSWASWSDIGHRAFIAAASDIAAMGARARASLLALILPDGFRDEDLLEMIDGVAAASDECGAPVIGGNLGAGRELSITTTVIGEVDGPPLARAGAKPGDGIYVTGHVGGAALGYTMLRADRADHPDAALFLERWRRPTARLLMGERLRGTATSCIDVSDGVLQDLGHICESSGVGARIFAEELPLERGFLRLARELGEDPWALALGGGDDYELVFTAPASKVAKDLATRIGEVVDPKEGIVVLGEDGQPLSTARRGWEHFGG